MNLKISPDVVNKILEKHDVSVEEVHEAFANREMKFRREKRPEHLTNPTTLWFISETNAGRVLKIAFVPKKLPELKTAFPLED